MAGVRGWSFVRRKDGQSVLGERWEGDSDGLFWLQGEEW